jgi:hypothetical protein
MSHVAADTAEDTDVQDCVLFRVDKPGIYCVGYAASGIGGNCEAGLFECQKLRHSMATFEPGIGDCERRPRAWCYGFTDGSGAAKTNCWVSEKKCASMRKDALARPDMGDVSPCKAMQKVK